MEQLTRPSEWMDGSIPTDDNYQDYGFVKANCAGHYEFFRNILIKYLNNSLIDMSETEAIKFCNLLSNYTSQLFEDVLYGLNDYDNVYRVHYAISGIDKALEYINSYNYPVLSKLLRELKEAIKDESNWVGEGHQKHFESPIGTEEDRLSKQQYQEKKNEEITRKLVERYNNTSIDYTFYYPSNIDFPKYLEEHGLVKGVDFWTNYGYEITRRTDKIVSSKRRDSMIKSSTSKTIDDIVKNYESWSGFNMEPACKNCAKALKDAGFNKSDVQEFFYKDGIYNEETGEGTWDKDYVECVLKNINSSVYDFTGERSTILPEENAIAWNEDHSRGIWKYGDTWKLGLFRNGNHVEQEATTDETVKDRWVEKYNMIESSRITSASRMPGAVKSSRKPIKSSLDEKLILYVDEFEEGYSDAIIDAEEDPDNEDLAFNLRLQSFEDEFAKSHNLTEAEINELRNEVESSMNAMDFNTYNAVDLAFPELDAKAKNIITRWYEAEDAIDDFDSTEEFAEYIKSDIYAMLDAAAGDERKFVDKALKKSGYAH